MDYCDGSVTEGGEGVQNSLNLCDVIYERPLILSDPEDGETFFRFECGNE